jgi:hypothetical protein
MNWKALATCRCRRSVCLEIMRLRIAQLHFISIETKFRILFSMSKDTSRMSIVASSMFAHVPYQHASCLKSTVGRAMLQV